MSINYMTTLGPDYDPTLTRGTNGSAGLDLRALKIVKTYNNFIMYDTGVAVQIPYGYVGKLYGRSSLHKRGYMLANCVGIIDSDYRDSIKVVLSKIGEFTECVMGERIAQLVISKVEMLEPTLVLSFDDDKLERVGGFGSTNT